MYRDSNKGPSALAIAGIFLMISGFLIVMGSSQGTVSDEVHITAHFPGSMYEEAPTSILVITTDEDGNPVGDESIYIALDGPEGRLPLYTGRTDSSGMLASNIIVPTLTKGYDQLEIGTADQLLEEDIEVIRPLNVLISTDKPLYQPGQTINIRTLSLEGKVPAPSQAPVRIEIRDADNNLIFRKDLTPNEFGVADTSLLLSDQLNMGTYTIKAISKEK
ncbi:MAG: hypothetical protein JXA22_01405, partial [Candidatus Thermoplasmatota archaeon]|nr:hypothetical protein [Candidatus Thermoplasmatota archaeon]